MQSKINKITKWRYFELVVTILIASVFWWLLIVVNESNKVEILPTSDLDIVYEYYQSQQIATGESPYARIEKGDLLNNHKYATLLPLYYYFLHQVDVVSNYDFYAFITNLRNLLYLSQLVSCIVIYLVFRDRGNRFVGFLAAAFSVFNRWSISNISTSKQDYIAIALVLVALYLFQKFKRKEMYWAYFLFGLSLGIKHLGVFLSPIFLLPLLDKKYSIKDKAIFVILLLIPTLGAALPMIFANGTAFMYSMLFSFTRAPSVRGSASDSGFGYHNLLVLYDVGVKNNSIRFYLLPRLPLVIFSALNFFALLARRISIFAFPLLAFFIFIAFNPVLFNQYFAWVVPFVFMATLDVKYPKNS